jgi:dihydropyrimidinase
MLRRALAFIAVLGGLWAVWEGYKAFGDTMRSHAPPRPRARRRIRAIQLARVAGCRLYVVHVSCQESIDPIATAREKGWDVWGETCMQYFFIDYSFLERPDFEGAKYVYTPPPRSKENQERLWEAVQSDVLSVISTDHCAFLWDGQKTLGRVRSGMGLVAGGR